MSLSVTVLFDKPQQEIASILRDRLQRCSSVSMVAGFLTIEGLEAIAGPIRQAPSKLDCLVIGAGTYRAFDALDRLISAGVQQGRLHVHLGHTRATGTTAKQPFYRYHPMLHSKVYLLDMGSGQTTAFVGSHNLTGFALLGLNGEASILLEGPSSDPEFAKIRNHISLAEAQATPYNSTMKEAYAWWTMQAFEGLVAKANDAPSHSETKRTIVILAAVTVSHRQEKRTSSTSSYHLLLATSIRWPPRFMFISFQYYRSHLSKRWEYFVRQTVSVVQDRGIGDGARRCGAYCRLAYRKQNKSTP